MQDNHDRSSPPEASSPWGTWPSWSDPFPASHGAAGLEVPDVLTSSFQALGTALEKDPTLRAVENALNTNPLHEVVPVDWAEILRSLRKVWFLANRKPEKALASFLQYQTSQAQTAMDAVYDIWQRWLGFGSTAEPPKPGADKRFQAPEWQANPGYRALKDLYLMGSEWLLSQLDEVEEIDPHERRRLEFHLRQFVAATSPTLMLMSNPAAMRKAFETGGASLAAGARNLAEDLKAGKLSMVDATAFAPGQNLALSPGKVVYRNKLIELIQYTPKTETVHATPILFLPPWINKFYILDLNPAKSMVRHLVEAGFTVFMVSWRNPDSSMETTTIEDYLDLGPLAASDVARAITGSERVNVMGYCIGGTLLAMTLAWAAAKGDTRFNAATFMVSLQDFATVGDTAIFLGEEQSVDFIEQQMLDRGYLDGRELSNMFNLLRSDDLIWSNVVNNYLMGQKPPAFDLLFWNSDSTRMARAAHSWYLRNTYVENRLIEPGRIELKGEQLDLGRIKNDVYAVGAEKDHIVPWGSAARIQTLMGGQVRYVLASSGHIAGIINPPGGKGTYWTNENGRDLTPDSWRAGSQKHDGSWWPDWFAWLAERSGERVSPPPMGNDAHPPMEDAPGTYIFDR